MLDATGIHAFHRSGQTFITWNEAINVGGEHYNVYRYSSPITTANLSQAQKLTSKWGPLDDATSVNKLSGPNSPATFVINDLGTPLSGDQGLFVHTTAAGNGGSWYYAVTQITNGVEILTINPGSNATTSAVVESPAAPAPVLVSSVNNGSGRVYTQFMDYAHWNPTFQGYAYNYAVALPQGYNGNTAYPLKLTLHAYGGRYEAPPEAQFGWQAIQVFPDDPGGDAGTTHTWWYGFAADHNYQTQGPIPANGVIENFTEQRLLRTIDEVIANFSVDTSRIHAQGNSMGASGALSLGIRYGNVFSGVYGSLPMTNYAASPLFQEDFQKLWGTQQNNLPVVSHGAHASAIWQFDGTGVYNWMNHQEQVVRLRGIDMAFLTYGQGTADTTIDWATQGVPFIAALYAGNIAFTAETRAGWDHTWMGFSGINHDMFTGGFSHDLGDYVFRNDVSYPALSLASDSGPVPPATNQTGFYNLSVNWATSWNAFHSPIVDMPEHYEITLASKTSAQTANITPRNLQQLVVNPGSTFQWRNINNSTAAVVASGTVTADSQGLLTIPQFLIGTGVGNRLILDSDNSSTSKPQITAPTGVTTDPTPTFSWTGVSGASSYRVWISNLSTGASPFSEVTVSGTSYTPTADLPLGRYTVWVQANLSSGGTSPWSAGVAFQVRPAPSILTTTVDFESPTPQFTWTPVTGATRYEVWVNNLSTGQTPQVSNSGVSGTSLTLPSLGIGRYRIWVRAFNAQDDYSTWSQPHDFRVVTRPVLQTPNSGSFTQPASFNWNAVAGATSYGVYLRYVENNATIFYQQGVTSTSFANPATLAAGDYRWWVIAKAADGTASFWSPVEEFSVAGRPVLFGPSGSTTDTTPTFTWEAFGGAVRYILHVSSLDGAGVVIREDFLTATSFTAPTPLASGSYRWWVQAVSGSGQFSFWSIAQDFTIA
ncbi:MAG: alpha/beta hydrolase-fold protein [Planctomycetaceae bacterium]